MSDGFLKFKKKFQHSAVIISLVFGVSLGILTASTFIVIQKLIHNTFLPLFPILAGVGAMILGCGLALIITLPRDKRLAKRLDNELNLGEKTQTMLANMDKTSDMIIIQRMDTDRRLKEAPTSLLKRKNPLVNAIAPVLAIAMLIPAILIPIKAVNPPIPEEEPDYNVTSWQITAVKELIEWVEQSPLEDPPKADVLLELNNLLVSLDTPKPESELKAYVIAVILNISRAIDAVDTYNELALALGESDNDYLKAIGAAIASLSALTLKQELDSTKAKITKDELASFEIKLREAIGKAPTVENDELAPALTALADAYLAIHSVMDSYTDQWISSNISAAHDNFYEILKLELFAQNENEKVRREVIRRLVEIFGIGDDELPDEIKSIFSSGDKYGDDGVYDDNDNDDKLNSGGYGNAEQVFGSNDTVYDPETNTHVSYGQLLNAYYAAVKEQLIAGGTPETLQQFIDSYFSSLYDGSKDKD